MPLSFIIAEPAARMSTSPRAKASGKKGRNESPAPKAKSQPLLTPTPVPKKDEKKDESHKNICGLHPDIFWVLIMGPVLVAIIIGAASTHDVGQKIIAAVLAKWSTIAKPVEKFIVTNKDIMVVGFAGVSFLPFALVLLVTAFRATLDVFKFPCWQQVIIYAIIGGALYTVISTKDILWTVNSIEAKWNTVKDPVEAFFATRADSIVAGMAIMCLFPIAAALVAYVIRGVWGCRVKIVPVEEKAK